MSKTTSDSERISLTKDDFEKLVKLVAEHKEPNEALKAAYSEYKKIVSDSEEAGREKSDLMRIVSWLKQRKNKHEQAMLTAKSKVEHEEEQFLYNCFKTVLEIAERENKEAN